MYSQLKSCSFNSSHYTCAHWLCFYLYVLVDQKYLINSLTVVGTAALKFGRYYYFLSGIYLLEITNCRNRGFQISVILFLQQMQFGWIQYKHMNIIYTFYWAIFFTYISFLIYTCDFFSRALDAKYPYTLLSSNEVLKLSFLLWYCYVLLCRTSVFKNFLKCLFVIERMEKWHEQLTQVK